MKRNYEMITVKEYVEEKLSETEKYTLTSVEKYLEQLNKEEKAA